MSTVAGAPVVVGVDGSAPSSDAVRLAAHEAERRRRPVRVAHAFVWPQLHVPLTPSPFGPPHGGLRHEAEKIVSDAVAEARAAAPDVTVTGEVVDGSAAPVLLHESRHAALLVLGHRGLGGFTGLLVGSVAAQVAAHAECPVVIARAADRPDGPVLVGVDGSPLSDLAIGFAMEEAAMRGSDVVAVHAWRHPLSTGPGDMLPVVFDIDALEADEDRLLAESLGGWCERYPDVRVTHRLVRGRAAGVLVAESGQAQLVVVGARGLGGFAGLLLGSVTHALLYHSRCPVAIVRPRKHEP
jgi:nucleotide-binding universal stress UspA family protein